MKLKKRQRYKITWKGDIYGFIHEYHGTYLGDNKFNTIETGEIEFEPQEIIKIEETNFNYEEPKEIKKESWLDKLAKKE